VEDVLQKEFGRSMTDENVHILDPFTGTGTFITRLLQSGIILNKDLKRKYTKEIHANEIVLLAYYIASINIENVYHDIVGIREWGPGSREEKQNDKNIQRPFGLAGSDEFGRDDIQSDKEFSKRRNLRTDQPNTAGGSLDSSQYSRGQRTEKPERVPSLSVHSKWFPLRTGNTHNDSRASNIYSTKGSNNNTGSTDNRWPDVEWSMEVAEREPEYGKIENRDQGTGNGDHCSKSELVNITQNFQTETLV
jgi:hypothetical protein